MSTGSSTTSDAPPPDRAGRLERRAGALLRLGVQKVVWVAVLAGAAYLVVLAALFDRILDAFLWNADYASLPVLAQGLADGDDRPLVLATFGSHSAITFDLATSWLPFHEEIWRVWPLLLSLGGAALLGWACARLAGRWAGLTAAAIAVAASPPVLLNTITQARSATFFTVELLAAALVVITTPPAWLGPRRAVAAAVLVAVITGFNAASDPLVIVIALAPAVGACLVLAVRHRRRAEARLAAWSAGLGAVALVVAAVVKAAFEAVDIRALGPTAGRGTVFATEDQLQDNVGKLGSSVLEIGNATFLGQHVDAGSILALACAPIVIAGMLAVLFVGRRAVTAPAPRDRADTARALFLLYWALTVAVAVLAFLFSDLPQTAGPGADRYLLSAFFAAAAVVPVVTAGRCVWLRAGVAICAALFCLASLLALDDAARSDDAYAVNRESRAALEFVEARGLTRGYAGYSDAHPLTLRADGRTDIRPVLTCGPTLCPFFTNVLEGWYRPRPEGRSFLIVNPSVLIPIAEPPPAFGPPVERFSTGTLTILVYAYDIATRFVALPG